MFLMAYALLATYEAYYLLQKIGSAVADVPQQIFLGTLVQSAVIVAASLIGGHLSDRTGRRKIFVFTASIVYGVAMFAIADRQQLQRFPRRHGHQRTRLRRIRGRRPRARRRRAAEPGQCRQGSRRVQHRRRSSVFHRAGVAPAILAIGGGSYGVLYAVAGVCAIIGAVTILPVKRVR